MTITQRWTVLAAIGLCVCPFAFAIIDRNSDGMSDIFTDLYSGVSGNPEDDNDNDGRDNVAESVAGTNPADPFSVFGCYLMKDENGQVLVVWPEVPGKKFIVQGSEHLVQDSWSDLEGTPFLTGNFWYYETGWPPQQQQMMMGGPSEPPVLESTADGPTGNKSTARVQPLRRYNLQIEDFGNGLAALMWIEYDPVDGIAAIREGKANLPAVGYRTYRMLTNLDVSVLPPEGIWRDRRNGYELYFRVNRPSWMMFDLTFEISWHYDLNRVFGFGYNWASYLGEDGAQLQEGRGTSDASRRQPVRFYDAPFAGIPNGGYESLGAPQNEFLRWAQTFLKNNRDAVAAMNPPMMMLMSERRELAETGDISTSVVFWRVRVEDQDSDEDGLTDWEELQLGMNPNSADSDTDDLLDGFEIFYFDDLDETGSGDFDNDRLSNKDEMELGTDPAASDAGGKTLTYQHNAGGWLTSVSGPQIAGSYTYDAEGNINPAP